ncbi:enoyl-CoA hydratase-related protein [Pigmentiphaga sp. NML080357]|uniref:enoyl-CoA hydratase-related protein n=1 Tax=Pigmentiphaga sp. NML080357 TaxID=2008675 RepID=UPI001E3D3F3C|nr:enoyl-CoA hydratase-related protein [Pigmentiphaga sp. NML080357]
MTLTLDEPDSLNRFHSENQFVELAEQVRAAGDDPSVGVLVVTGAGRAFCAGGDIRSMAKREGFSAGSIEEIQERYRRSIHQLPRALHGLDIPTIAAVNGPAYGAGCDLACYCDIRLASSEATFCMSFARIGLIPGDGGAWILPRLVGRSRAMELIFTARVVDAQEALRIGLVSQVLQPDTLLAEAGRLAESIARHPREVLRMAKRLVRGAEETGLDTHLESVSAFQAIAHVSEAHRAAADATMRRLSGEADAGAGSAE